jgi:hypothetical protein
MKTYNTRIIVLIMIVSAPISGIAQGSKNIWEGAYGQVGLIGYASLIPAAANGTTTTPMGTSFSTFSTANHSNGFAANIGAGYNLAINERYLLGVGAAFYPGSSRSASTTSTNALSTTNGTYSVANVFSVFVSPSYVIDQEKLAYAKIGYTEGTLRISASGNAMGNFPQQSLQTSGTVFGLGFKQILLGSIYGFAEANYVLNNPKSFSVTTDNNLLISSTAKASGYDVLLGIGYRF